MLANLRLLVSTMLLFAAALLPSALPAATAASRPQPNTPEAILFNAANRDRATAGLPAFHWDANLAEAARLHAERMAQHNTLSHQLPGEAALQDRAQQAGARFSMIAENIAEGPSPQGLHTQWMNSAPHRANLLDRQLNSIGIAVVQRGNVFFAAEDFAATVPHLSFEEQEAQVRAQLADYGLRLESDAADARKTCAMDRGFAGAEAGAGVALRNGRPQPTAGRSGTARAQRQVSLGSCRRLRSQRRGDIYTLPHRHRVLLSADWLRRRSLRR